MLQGYRRNLYQIGIRIQWASSMYKLIIALIWAFWMMGVDSSLGREHNDKEEQIKKIIKVTNEESPEYNPTYGSTLERVLDNGVVTCVTKMDFTGFSEKVWDE